MKSTSRWTHCSGWVEEEGEKMETEEKVWRDGWRGKSEKEEQGNLSPEKSHLTRNRPNKYATWNICLLLMTA